jgi:hypothetical protein
LDNNERRGAATARLAGVALASLCRRNSRPTSSVAPLFVGFANEIMPLPGWVDVKACCRC